MTTITAEEDAAAAATTAEPPGPRWPRVARGAGLAALAVPFVAVIVLAVTHPWLPGADLALMELRIHDVGGPHTPLLGAYSRLGWNHPGPLSFWLLAIPHRLLGGGSVGTLIGTVALHAAAVAACLAMARRRGGSAVLALVGLGLALLIRGYGAGYLVLPWNPDLPALATAALILATWSVLEGDLWLLPVAVALSCFSWQSHLGYLPVSGALAAVALAGAAVRARGAWREGGDARRRAGAAVGATAVTAGLCLAPLAVDQVIHDPGNLRLIVHSLRHPEGEAVGFARAAHIAAQHLSPVGTWSTGVDPLDPYTAAALGAGPWYLLLPVGAVIAAAVVARRARDGAALRLLLVTGLAALAGYVAVARTTGIAYFYLFTWLRPVAMLLWAAVVWAAGRAAVRAGWLPVTRRAAARNLAVVATAAATAAAAVGSLASGPGLTLSDEATSGAVRALTPALVAATAGMDEVDLTMAGGWCAGEIGNGLGLQLVEHGTEVMVRSELDLAYGPFRVRPGRRPRVELICGPGAVEYIAQQPTRPVAEAGLLSPAELDELRSLQERYRAQLRAAGRDDLLPAVENHGIAIVVRHGDAPAGFDASRIDRFEELMLRGQHAAAVFVHPAPPA